MALFSSSSLSFQRVGAGQQVGGLGHHGLALVAIGDLAVRALGGVAGFLLQGGGQFGADVGLGLVDAGQLDAGAQGAQAVSAREAGVLLQSA